MAIQAQAPLTDPTSERVPGVNGNAVYCTVPRSEQLFSIEFLDIAPQPVPVDQIFFTYMRGRPKEGLKTGLETAQLRITMSAELSTGDSLEPASCNFPLATMAFNSEAHLTIRYPADGPDGPDGGSKFGGPLLPGKTNDILTDWWFPGMFMQTGYYTFKIEAFIPGPGAEGEKYLFAFQVSQELKGERK